MAFTCFYLAVSSQKRNFFYFSVLSYIANFEGAEMQFSRILIGVHAKLLVDPIYMKL